MAECSSSCLLRSFSAPSDNPTLHQDGNPMRVFGESISLGRFMTESLDWDKWSAFTQNRYVEEAEKYSKPGSVAAKRAYFEAHYKKKTAEKAAVMQEANAQANGTFDSETQEANCADDKQITVESKPDGIRASIEQPDEDAIEYRVVDCANTNQCDVEQRGLDISNVEGAAGNSDQDISNMVGERDVSHPCGVTIHNVESCTENIALPGEEKMPNPGAADEQVLPLPVEGTELDSSPKLSTKTRAAKLSHSLNERKATTALPPRSGINKENRRLATRLLHMSINLPSGTGETSRKAAEAAQSRYGVKIFPESKKSVEGSVAKRLSARSLYASVNLPSRAGETSKTAAAASAVKPRNVINKEARSMKSAGDSTEKRPTARSFHMSINLPSGAGVKSKMTYCPISTKASHDSLNQASENPISQPRSCLKSSSTTKINPRPSTISSPFRFRSEERAVKRKEFFQRLDEIKNKEAEKVELQSTPKDTVEHDHKKLQQSSVSKPKLNEDKHDGSKTSQSNQIRKSSLMLPRSPKCGKKASSSTVQENNFGNSWKPPMSSNASKRVTEKLNRTTRLSASSLLNVTRENASPNIQH